MRQALLSLAVALLLALPQATCVRKKSEAPAPTTSVPTAATPTSPAPQTIPETGAIVKGDDVTGRRREKRPSMGALEAEPAPPPNQRKPNDDR